jgi:protein phosphatase
MMNKRRHKNGCRMMHGSQALPLSGFRDNRIQGLKIIYNWLRGFKNLLIKSSGITDVGLKREGNEDSFSVDDSLGLYIVADGMGGHLAGEIASHISVDIINRSYKRWLEENASADEIYGGADDSLSREGNYVLGGIRLANRVVYELAYEKKQYQGMGTTVVTLLVTPSMIIAANVGDSRIYMLRDGELEMLSTDHTIVAEQVALGMMTEEEAANSSMKHILTRNLGSSETVEPEIYEIDPSGSDRFIICSDGLTDLVNDEEIRKMMEDANDLRVMQGFYPDSA